MIFVDTPLALVLAFMREPIFLYMFARIYERICACRIISLYESRVPTGQGKVREICFFFKVREKSGNFKKWSVKFKNLKKSG